MIYTVRIETGKNSHSNRLNKPSLSASVLPALCSSNSLSASSAVCCHNTSSNRASSLRRLDGCPASLQQLLSVVYEHGCSTHVVVIVVRSSTLPGICQSNMLYLCTSLRSPTGPTYIMRVPRFLIYVSPTRYISAHHCGNLQGLHTSLEFKCDSDVQNLKNNK